MTYNLRLVFVTIWGLNKGFVSLTFIKAYKIFEWFSSSTASSFYCNCVSDYIFLKNNWNSPCHEIQIRYKCKILKSSTLQITHNNVATWNFWEFYFEFATCFFFFKNVNKCWIAGKKSITLATFQNSAKWLVGWFLAVPCDWFNFQSADFCK